MPSNFRSAVVLRHVTYEGLDALEPILISEGFTITYVQVPTAADFAREVAEADLVVILGGPMGVYQTDRYPYLQYEIDVVAQRLADKKPVLGLCLGAQIMAAALGARVYRGDKGGEVGWYDITLTDAGKQSALASLNGLRVLQWHYDTFDLPAQATRLASSAAYENQAFSVGKHALAMQFHIETSAPGLERWFKHLHEKLEKAGVNMQAIRYYAVRHAPLANRAAVEVIASFLQGIPQFGNRTEAVS